MAYEFSNDSLVKVPSCITCYFCAERNFLLVRGKIGSKLIKLEAKIFLLAEKNTIAVTDTPTCMVETLQHKNNRKGLKTRTKTLIKKAFLDITRRSYKKLKVFGIGFKVDLVVLKQLKLLKLELGYSHSIYYKIPEDIAVIITSSTKFIVSGSNCDRVMEISSQIRRLKLPESYKGKGILYEGEEVILKVVKKS